jgi:prevent-host-death family protein
MPHFRRSDKAPAGVRRFGSGVTEPRAIGVSQIFVADVQSLLSVYTTYMSTTEPLNITEARKQFATIIDQARTDHEPVYLTRRGHRVAAVIDADDLDGILALAEDMADIRAAEDARVEMRATGEAPIPWEQVKVDLGLV